MGGLTQAEVQEQVVREYEAQKAETEHKTLGGKPISGVNGGFFGKIWAEQLKMWKALGPGLKTGGITGVVNWAKIFIVPLVIFIVTVIIVWSVIKPSSRRTGGRYGDRSHHGVNKFGERY